MGYPTLADYYSQPTVATTKIVFKRNELKTTQAMADALLRCKELYSKDFHFITIKDNHEQL
jgi:hypothetical protein